MLILRTSCAQSLSFPAIIFDPNLLTWARECKEINELLYSNVPRMSNIKEMQNTNGVKSLDSLNATERDLLAVALGAPARQVLLRIEEIGFVFQSVLVIVWNLKPLFHRSWRMVHIKCFEKHGLTSRRRPRTGMAWRISQCWVWLLPTRCRRCLGSTGEIIWQTLAWSLRTYGTSSWSRIRFNFPLRHSLAAQGSYFMTKAPALWKE
jgi:hypothetical protein